ncbi:MAG TPA: glycosyltransferase [Acidimicrobiales bacterium]|nr:glycosyltransferase [Acidimicrobiales bacterium]
MTDDRAGRSGGGRHWRHWLARSGRSSSPAGVVGTAATTAPWADIAEPITYPEWVARYDALDDDRLAAVARQVDALADPPTFSVVLPVHDPPTELLRAAIDSVRAQLYPRWELCIADDGSRDPAVVRLLDDCAGGDQRVKVVHRAENGHISAASNTALALATGRWVAFLDHDDLLAPHALALMAVHLADRPDAGVAYSDEDLVDYGGEPVASYFKPAFDPLLLLAQNHVCHLAVVRRDLVEQVGGLREGYEGSQDWDLLLRVTAGLDRDQVVHVPHVLYHWRTYPASTASSLGAKPYAAGAGWRAVRDHLAGSSTAATVDPVPGLGWNRVSWPLPEPAPLVSIVVLASDEPSLARCLQSIWVRTTYPSYEVVVVTTGTTAAAVRALLDREAGRVVVADASGPDQADRPGDVDQSGGQPDGRYTLFNRGAARASGDVLCFLDEATEIVSPEWLDVLVGHVSQPGVGVAGATIYDASGRLRHAGLVLGLGGVAGPIHEGLDRLDIGYWGRAAAPRHVAAVGGDGLVVRRDAWERVAGFDAAHLPADYGDVDFCLRLRDAGWSTVWTPFAELISHRLPRTDAATATDGPGNAADAEAEAGRYMRQRWGPALDDDPAYSPNLSLERGDCRPACPPRAQVGTAPHSGVRRS